MENGKIKDEGSPDEIIKEFVSEMDAPETSRDLKTVGEPVIKVEDIERRFFLIKGGNVLEIKDINFQVREGEVVSLIGPSGAGKTVLLRMIAGIDVPDAGEVFFKLNGDWVNM